MTKDELKPELKQLIIDACKLDMEPKDMIDSDPLVQTGLGLDSIEALQVLVELEVKYGIEITDTGAQEKRVLESVDKLTDFIWGELNENP